ncbi:hypothetical protein [Segniliparus rugosus]|uniref:hypothetical protein n=1 Tax=Segniliparus rugosus TaxID=286804 RepID=UPI001FCB74BA|nr:hypothetical protein [Segniliparus rugosus]
MSEPSGFSLDSEESEAVCRAVLKSLGERHQLLADKVADTSDFEGAADEAGRRAQELARAAKARLAELRLAGAARTVGTVRNVFSGVALVREMDFEAEYGLKSAGARIGGSGS